jgi:mannose-1-phosphate guanylyltransferase
LVINGDSLIDTNIADFIDWAESSTTGSALIATKVSEARRYGTLRLAEDGLVEAFDEKPPDNGPAWINAGVYWLDATVLQLIDSIGRGSLERSVLSELPPDRLAAYCSRGRFIDIGTPESLALADRWPLEAVEPLREQRA